MIKEFLLGANPLITLYIMISIISISVLSFIAVMVFLIKKVIKKNKDASLEYFRYLIPGVFGGLVAIILLESKGKSMLDAITWLISFPITILLILIFVFFGLGFYIFIRKFEQSDNRSLKIEKRVKKSNGPSKKTEAKRKWLIFGFPFLCLLLGGGILIWAINLTENIEEKWYHTRFMADNVNISEDVRCNFATFHYDFSNERGHFKFVPAQDIQSFSMWFPTKLKKDSLKVYNFIKCDTESSRICNKVEILDYTLKTLSEPAQDYYFMGDFQRPARDFININFERNIEREEPVVVEFSLENFEPSGVFVFERTNKLVLYSSGDGNVIFNLGKDYSCEECFFDALNIKERSFYSSPRTLRLDFENQVDENDVIIDREHRFKVISISKENIRKQNIGLTAGISLSISMFALICSLLVEIFILRKKELEIS